MTTGSLASAECLNPISAIRTTISHADSNLLISAHDVDAMPWTAQQATNRIISIPISSNIFGCTSANVAGILDAGPGAATVFASMTKIVVVTHIFGMFARSIG